MSTVKISQLSATSGLNSADVLPVVNSGANPGSPTTYKITVKNLADSLTQVTSSISSSYASNGGVTSITAGTGISINASTGNVTITNTGGGGSTFPYTGSALITGSLGVTGSINSTAGFTGSLLGTASYYQLVAGFSGSNFNIFTTPSGSVINIPTASMSSNGLLTSQSQTIEGIKTFNRAVQFLDKDEFDTANTNLSLGDWKGAISSSNSRYTGILGSTTTFVRVGFGGGSSGGGVSAARTNQFGVIISSLCPAFNSGITGSLLAQLAVRPFQNILASSTVTASATVYIEGSSSFFNTTQNYSLWVDSGPTRLDGNLLISGSLNQGLNNSTIGEYSHAQGFQTTTSGDYSHAEGDRTAASGFVSHAEGRLTSASNQYSHAEGEGTNAAGYASHAEGTSTLASGSFSHAEGSNTQALSIGSHAEGLYTVASGSYQHVQGKYNASSSIQAAFILGNGTSDSARSNLIFAAGSEVQVTGSMIVSGSSTMRVIGALAVGAITPSATVGRIDAANDIVAYSTSDARLKTEVSPIHDPISKVNMISGVNFTWIENAEVHGNSGKDVGVIAQEIEKVLPEVVTTRDNGYKAVKYEKIVPLLIEAIKDLQKQIDELKAGK